MSNPIRDALVEAMCQAVEYDRLDVSKIGPKHWYSIARAALAASERPEPYLQGVWDAGVAALAASEQEAQPDECGNTPYDEGPFTIARPVEPIAPTEDELRAYRDTLRSSAALAASEQEAQPISPSEAVYGFAAWLTTRSESVTFGSSENAALAADLVDAFVISQGWAEPRTNFADNLKPYPVGEPKP